MMEKITIPIIQMGDSKGIDHILERLNFHNTLELIVDEVAQQLHIKSVDLVRQELDPIFPRSQMKEDETLPLIKAKVIPNPDFNPWDD